MSGLKIGDTIWIYNINRRVYEKDEHGRSKGGPIYREHWQPHVIESETRLSWVTQRGEKVPKKGGNYLTSLEEIEADVWDHENRYEIGHRIQRGRSMYGIDTTLLRQIADLIGYESDK